MEHAPGINWRGRVRTASGSSLPDNLLVTARSKVWGQLLDPLPALVTLRWCITLCAVLWLLVLQLQWDEITYLR